MFVHHTSARLLTLIATFLFQSLPISSVAVSAKGYTVDIEDRLSLWQNGQSSLTFITRPDSSLTASAVQQSGAGADDVRVFFRSFRDGNWNIYRANGDLAGQTAIHTDASTEIRPRARLGGGNVIYISNRTGSAQIFRQDFDGTDLQQLTTSGNYGYPEWSPDGKKIAFASNNSGAWHVYTQNVDGSGQQCLTCEDALEHIAPAWSPDGRSIAWLVVIRGTGQSELKVMNADGTGKRTLATNLYLADTPRWSPDGTHIAFDYTPHVDLWNRLAVVNVQTGGGRTIYDANQNMVDISMGSWAPDGQTIYLTRWEYVSQNGQLFIQASHIERISWLGGTPQRLSTSGRDATPDARRMDTRPPVSSLRLPAWSQAAMQHVSITGSDADTGIDHYEIQTKNNPAAPWSDWKTIYHVSETFLSGTPGQQVFMRVRAHDYAGNVEAWPASDLPDASTTLFAHTILATTTDNRGWPVPAPVIAASVPVTSTTSSDSGGGNTAIYSQWLAPFTFSLSKTSYGALDSHQIESSTVRLSTRHAFPPITSTVVNGGFESGVAGPAWITQGSASVGGAARHTGAFGATIGEPYTTVATALSTNGDRVQPIRGLFFDPTRGDGIFGVQPDGRIAFMHTQSSGSTALTSVDTGLPSFSGPWGVSIVQTDAGYHVLWLANSAVMYCLLPSSTLRCATPQVIGSTPAWLNIAGATQYGSTHIFADASGGVTLVWLIQDDVNSAPVRTTFGTRRRNANGTWSAAIVFPNMPMHGSNYTLAAGPSQVLHALWTQGNALWYMSLNTSGVWSTPHIVLDSLPSPSVPLAVATNDNALHLFAYANERGHLVRRPDGEWVANTISPIAWAGADRHGKLHTLRYGTDELIHAVLTPDGSWTDVGVINYNSPSYGGSAFIAAVNPAGQLTTWMVQESLAQPVTRHAPVAAGSAINAISTRVAVSAGIKNPTLSFVHRNALSAGASTLRVTIASGSSTASFDESPNADGTWKLGSHDLSIFAGQTVTVTFENQRNGTAAPAFLDEVAVGEWDTPVILQNQPSRVPAVYASTALTLTGVNFGVTPTLAIGPGIVLTQVSVISSGMIIAQLPAGLPFGAHDLMITNPDGKQFIRSGAVQVGERVWLTTVLR